MLSLLVYTFLAGLADTDPGARRGAIYQMANLLKTEGEEETQILDPRLAFIVRTFGPERLDTIMKILAFHNIKLDEHVQIKPMLDWIAVQAKTWSNPREWMNPLLLEDWASSTRNDIKTWTMPDASASAQRWHEDIERRYREAFTSHWFSPDDARLEPVHRLYRKWARAGKSHPWPNPYAVLMYFMGKKERNGKAVMSIDDAMRMPYGAFIDLTCSYFGVRGLFNDPYMWYEGVLGEKREASWTPRVKSVIREIDNGYKLIQMGTRPEDNVNGILLDYQEESTILGHCIGTSTAYTQYTMAGDHIYWSIRTPDGYSLVSCEVQLRANRKTVRSFLQMKCAKNSTLHPFFYDIVLSLLGEYISDPEIPMADNGKDWIEWVQMECPGFVSWVKMNPVQALNRCKVMGPDDNARLMICDHGTPDMAFEYAKLVDKAPHPLTRVAASRAGDLALRYALEIDGRPNEVTRKGACAHGLAFQYAEKVDKVYHPDTFAAVEDRFFDYITRFQVPNSIGRDEVAFRAHGAHTSSAKLTAWFEGFFRSLGDAPSAIWQYVSPAAAVDLIAFADEEQTLFSSDLDNHRRAELFVMVRSTPLTWAAHLISRFRRTGKPVSREDLTPIGPWIDILDAIYTNAEMEASVEPVLRDVYRQLRMWKDSEDYDQLDIDDLISLRGAVHIPGEFFDYLSNIHNKVPSPIYWRYVSRAFTGKALPRDVKDTLSAPMFSTYIGQMLALWPSLLRDHRFVALISGGAVDPFYIYSRLEETSKKSLSEIIRRTPGVRDRFLRSSAKLARFVAEHVDIPRKGQCAQEDALLAMANEPQELLTFIRGGHSACAPPSLPVRRAIAVSPGYGVVQNRGILRDMETLLGLSREHFADKYGEDLVYAYGERSRAVIESTLQVLTFRCRSMPPGAFRARYGLSCGAMDTLAREYRSGDRIQAIPTIVDLLRKDAPGALPGVSEELPWQHVTRYDDFAQLGFAKPVASFVEAATDGFAKGNDFYMALSGMPGSYNALHPHYLDGVHAGTPGRRGRGQYPPFAAGFERRDLENWWKFSLTNRERAVIGRRLGHDKDISADALVENLGLIYLTLTPYDAMVHYQAGAAAKVDVSKMNMMGSVVWTTEQTFGKVFLVHGSVPTKIFSDPYIFFAS